MVKKSTFYFENVTGTVAWQDLVPDEPWIYSLRITPTELVLTYYDDREPESSYHPVWRALNDGTGKFRLHHEKVAGDFANLVYKTDPFRLEGACSIGGHRGTFILSLGKPLPAAVCHASSSKK